MKKFDVTKNINYPFKKGVVGRISVVLEGIAENRGLELISTRSRALCKNEIHEIILTDDINAGPGKIVDSISYIGFVEIVEGGVILAGDGVYVDDIYVGRVAGYDETHFPNHTNIVLFNEHKNTGTGYDLKLDSILMFKSIDAK